MVKLGFGAGSRWRLEHLNEFGYAKRPIQGIRCYPKIFGSQQRKIQI